MCFGSLELIEFFFIIETRKPNPLFYVVCFLSSASDGVCIDLTGIESITQTHRADSVTPCDDIHIRTLICRGEIELNVCSEP